MSWNENLEPNSAAFNLASSVSKTIRAVAGPGSGKSFAIKRRIARLLEEKMNPEEILAITFTRTAAQDLKREIQSIGVPGAELVHSRTLHSQALKILMQIDVLQKTGRNPRMVIDHEINPALKDIEKEEFGGLREKRKLVDSYLAAWACLQSDDPGFTKSKIQADFEKDFLNWLIEHEGLLVGEVIPVAIDFLRNNPASKEIGKYKVILVDEYQDLNRSEQEFIRLIRGNAEIVIVGDDDQSIYGFKFAHPAGIQELDQLHGEYEDITFDVCRRCPQQVSLMASALISNNTNRTLGDLKPYEGNHNGQVEIIQWNTYDDEISGITEIIKKELSNGIIKPEDILILAPRRRVGYRLRDSLLGNGLAVKSYFREAVISKESGQRAYSLLNFISNPNDLISLRFLLGFSSNDFRAKQYAKLKELSTKTELSILQTLQEILKGTISDSGLKTILAEFRKVQLDAVTARKEIINDPENAFQNLFIKTGDDEIELYELNQLYKNAVNEIGLNELKDDPNIFEDWFGRVFSNLQENIALPEPPGDIDHIRIMSLHASKGLSAKFVILCSMIDNLMPFVPADAEPQEKKQIIEEQRRLFYVAITRCKAGNDYTGRLIISSFLSIYGVEASRMGISANPRTYLSVLSTRFLKEFGETAPKSILGQSLV